MKNIFVCLMATLVCLAFIPPVFPQEVLIFSSHPEEAPLTWEKDGELIGVGPELVQRISRELGLSAEFRIFPWKRAVISAQHGDIDVLANVWFTEERAEFLAYCDSHTQSDTVVIVKKGQAFPFRTWDDLIGLTMGTILGESWGEEFDQFIAEKLTVERVARWEQNFKKLNAGRVDYLLGVRNNIEILVQQLGIAEEIEILPVPVNSEKVYIAFSKKSPFLKYLPAFNEKLNELKENGTIDALIRKYIEIASTEE